jgi:pyrroloquinoline quinone (PQQ) biosynthesis protein C
MPWHAFGNIVPGMLHSGGCSMTQVRAWVINCFYYLCRIPLKDAAFMGAEQEQSEIDGMEGSRSAGARIASVRMDKPGAFEWKRFQR